MLHRPVVSPRWSACRPLWSRRGFKRHCNVHLADKFSTCVGLIMQLRGNAFDGIKLAVARWALG